MMSSSKPRTQRLFRYTAPMHVRQHFVHVHIDKALQAKMPSKRRAIEVVKGDTVKVMSGAKRGTTGKVTRVDLKTSKLYIDSLKKKNARGKEFSVPVSSNNVYITDFNLSDKFRADRLKMKQQVQPKEKEEKKEAKEQATEEKRTVPQPSKGEQMAAAEKV